MKIFNIAQISSVFFVSLAILYSHEPLAQANTTHCTPSTAECVRVNEVIGTSTIVHIYPGLKVSAPPGPIA